MTRIAEKRVPNVGSYFVSDYGHPTSIGRYAIAKYRILPGGRVIISHVYRHQRPAAINHAEKWLAKLQLPAATV